MIKALLAHHWISAGILIFLLSLLQPTKAQDIGEVKYVNPKNIEPEAFGFMGASVGAAIPIGGFSSIDYTNSHAGYAGVGTTFHFLNAMYKLNNNFGVGAQWFNSSFTMNADAYLKPYRLYNTDYKFTGQAENWDVQSVTGNFVVTVPNKLLDFDVRFCAGLGRFIRPKISTQISSKATNSYLANWVQSESNASDLIWGFGCNLRWHIWRSLDLLAAADYQRMNTAFKVDHSYNGVFDRTVTERHGLEFFNLSLGAGVVLK